MFIIDAHEDIAYNELDTISGLRKIADALYQYGYQAEDIANILGSNWQRFLEHALPFEESALIST